MKEAWYFTKWLFRSISLEMWLWFIGSGFLGYGVDNRTHWTWHAGLLIMLVLIIKWFVVDILRYKWHQYREEKRRTFEKIKEETQ